MPLGVGRGKIWDLEIFVPGMTSNIARDFLALQIEKCYLCKQRSLGYIHYICRNHPLEGGGVFKGITLSVCLSRRSLTLAITFEPREIELSYYKMVVPCHKTFLSVVRTKDYDPVTFNLTFDRILKKT